MTIERVQQAVDELRDEFHRDHEKRDDRYIALTEVATRVETKVASLEVSVDKLDTTVGKQNGRIRKNEVFRASALAIVAFIGLMIGGASAAMGLLNGIP